MANKRMFSLQIVDTDAFLDMPQSAQALYFHLVMRADDEGFIDNPKKIMRLIGCQEDDMKILIAKRFILTFKSGIIVIKHWLIHNAIRMDRFNKTVYTEERESLMIKDNKAYTDKWQPNGNQLAPQVKLSKVKLSKVKLKKTQKNFNEQLEEYKEKYSPSMLEDFTLYWVEPDTKGKERWQKEKTWDMNLRLKRWKKQQERWDREKSNKFIKEEPKEVERKFGIYTQDGFQSIGEMFNNK